MAEIPASITFVGDSRLLVLELQLMLHMNYQTSVPDQEENVRW